MTLRFVYIIQQCWLLCTCTVKIFPFYLLAQVWLFCVWPCGEKSRNRLEVYERWMHFCSSSSSRKSHSSNISCLDFVSSASLVHIPLAGTRWSERLRFLSWEYRQVLYHFRIPRSCRILIYKVENHTLAFPIEMLKIVQNYDNDVTKIRFYRNLTTEALPVTLRFDFLTYVDGLASIWGFWNC